jgi:hypothetical protein
MLQLRKLPESSFTDKPPASASVKRTGGANQYPAIGPRCDTMALENLNRLDYISRVTASGVKADRP